ncbi:SDR family oxidoreductase [Spartinivicinus sp. A2-2]|uniref:SDR family oxidoreductase n=2 Tax=Spartinivicinus poritis TaxID=2994640 RepID=A0ABT5UHH3_9GAMM|nr:SDR family oxidoreductase [Spartinivicinus sp. A2-2]
MIIMTNPMGHFRNKVVVITGACAGIGRQLCLRFAKAGAWVAMLDLNQDELDTMVNHLESLNTQALGVKCDVADCQSVHEVFNHIIDHFAGIDVLINNAGITHRSAFVDTDIQVLRRVMEVNYFGAVHCTKAALPSLLERHGQLITMSSVSGYAPLWHRSGYNASKHALHGLFDCLRLEVAEQGVDVMLVCPGFTATDLNRNALQGDGGIDTHTFSWQGQLSSAVDVAEAIYQGALQRKRLLVLSNLNKSARFLYRLFPSFFERYIAEKMSGVNGQR